MSKLFKNFDNSPVGQAVGKVTKVGMTFGALAVTPGLLVGYSARHGMEKEMDAIGASLGQALIADMSMSRFEHTMALGTWRHAPGIGRRLPPVMTGPGGYDTGLPGPDR
jgi:hypothetical protein